VNVGIIGLGFMGATHLGAFMNSPGATVAAVSSSGPKKLSGDLSQVQGNLGRETIQVDLTGVAKYSDWRELIDHPGLDAVDICLPTDLHAPVAVRALQAGKHVLLEKPMALTLPECNAILASASDRGQVLMVAQVLRFWPEYLRLFDFVKSGKKGPVRTAMFERRSAAPSKHWAKQSSRSGGAIFDLLVHDIDQVLHLFGWPQAVIAETYGGVDTVDASLQYESGLQVQIRGGWFEEGCPFSMGFRAESDAGTLSLNSKGVLTCVSKNGSSLIIETDGRDAFQSEIDYFVECCLARRPPERCLPAESAMAVELALLLDKSRTEGGLRIACER
jgi:predicted dehydrogenase